MPSPAKPWKVSWTTQARREWWEAADHLMLERPSAGERWLHEAARALDHLQAFPEMGRVVPEFHQTMIREVFLSPYRIIYQVKSKERAVHILTVYHNRRILPAALPE